MTLREWRRQNGVSQVELAKRTGIQQDLLSKYENRRRKPKYQNRRAIAEATGGAVSEDSWDRRRSPKRSAA